MWAMAGVPHICQTTGQRHGVYPRPNTGNIHNLERSPEVLEAMDVDPRLGRRDLD